MKNIVRLLSFILIANLGLVISAARSEIFSGAREGSRKLEAFKGFELFSWKAGDEWNFSLLQGTNRLKTQKEVMAPQSAIKGIDALKQRLGQIKEGEEVFWFNNAIPGLSYPPDEVINELKKHCDGLKLKLTLKDREKSMVEVAVGEARHLTEKALFFDETPVVEEVIAELKKDKEQPADFYIQMEPREDEIVIHLWHQDAFKKENLNVVGNPGGKCRDFHYDIKGRKITKKLWWQ